jgi:hypothetical protein
VISKSLIVGMGLTGVGLGLAGSFAPPAEASPYICSASTIIGSCTQTLTQPLTQTEWTGTSVDLVMNLFNSQKYGPMTGISLVLSGTINFGSNSTITNTTTSTENYTFIETSSFTFSSALSALQSAINALSPPPIASDAATLTGLVSGQTITLSTAPGAAFSSTLTSSIYESAFETANGTSTSGGTTNLYADTLTSETTHGGGGNNNTSITTFATLTLAYVYSYGVAAPEPLSAAVLGSGLLGLGMLRRRKKRV